jgi:NADPH:quinone reductase-like Zn-dependent oxidoreductase
VDVASCDLFCEGQIGLASHLDRGVEDREAENPKPDGTDHRGRQTDPRAGRLPDLHLPCPRRGCPHGGEGRLPHSGSMITSTPRGPAASRMAEARSASPVRATVASAPRSRAHTRGGPEQLTIEQAPIPEPGPGEVLVQVAAAAITFAELSWDESRTTRDGRDRTPVIPSHEFSGTVVGLGPQVDRLHVGDEVYGLIDFDRDGEAATYTILLADHLALRPRSVSHAESAALPLAALTAWQALVYHAKLQPGQTLLVHGAGGGVGVYAVQLGRILDATVIGTDLPANESFVHDLGASRFIDVTTEAFDETTKDVDVVLDTVGGSTLERRYRVLGPGGRLVTLGAPAPAEYASRYGVQAIFFVVTPDRAELEQLASYVDDGRLRPVSPGLSPSPRGGPPSRAGHCRASRGRRCSRCPDCRQRQGPVGRSPTKMPLPVAECPEGAAHDEAATALQRAGTESVAGQPDPWVPS